MIDVEQLLLDHQKVELLLAGNGQQVGIGLRIFHQQGQASDVAQQAGDVSEIGVHARGASYLLREQRHHQTVLPAHPQCLDAQRGRYEIFERPGEGDRLHAIQSEQNNRVRDGSDLPLQREQR